MSIFRLLFIVLVICITSFAIWISLMLYGAVQEGRRAAEYRLYDEIGQRGFREQNLGIVARSFNLQPIFYPPSSLDDEIEAHGCLADIDVPKVDATQYEPVFAFFKRPPEFRLMYVYNGVELDFARYFESDSWPAILDDISRFDKNGSISTEDKVSSDDLRRSFDVYIRDEVFSIHSRECAAFSYTILTKRN